MVNVARMRRGACCGAGRNGEREGGKWGEGRRLDTKTPPGRDGNEMTGTFVGMWAVLLKKGHRVYHIMACSD